MSDIDQEEEPLTNWFDSEFNFPEISSVNSTPELGVNVMDFYQNYLECLKIQHWPALGPPTHPPPSIEIPNVVGSNRRFSKSLPTPYMSGPWKLRITVRWD